MSSRQPPPAFDGIAIIGMQGRFPGAPTIDAFWANLTGGVESISRLTTEQLIESGVPDSSLASPRYVRAKGLLDHIDQFDASFFGILPKDAAVMDPQQRLFLECAWEALERAGYDPATYDGPIGVYAGAYLDTYLLANLCSRPSALAELVRSIQVGTLQTELGNDKDYLATRVSFKLNLRGPSMTVQSACSTSLVAIAQACQSLVTYQCDMALAGGVTVTVPQAKGYDYQEDGMLSPDGHCRPFDARAQGTVFSNGLGVVVLKRLADAIADRDDVIAVIRGWALNNDGGSKLSYTAPSVDGQADVIAMAHAMAGVDARSISYVEAHGTATPLGDPIEIAALTQAFRMTTEDTRFCAIGSVKSNIGHLDVASGVAALMKTALSLRHRTLPPTLHYTTPNPKIDFEGSPFYVNDTLRQWPDASLPRRAGVSSFGVGGTNAHVILEEAPEIANVPAIRASQVLVVSARSAAALDRATAALATALSTADAPPLADVAYTLQLGRRAFSHRRVVVCSNHEEAVAALAPSASAPAAIVSHRQRGVAFMFPGQGSQSPGMGRALYETERVFQDSVDRCAGLLKPELGIDLRTLLYPSASSDEAAAHAIRQTVMAQPAIFTTSYALAQLWMSWGIEPGAFIGHSVGELVAACLAGVIALPDALRLLAARGRMMQAVEPGAMLAVRLSADAAMAIAGDDLDLAASNSPHASVLAGTHDAVLAMEQELARRGVSFARLATSHAFHSRMMDEVVAPFEAIAREIVYSIPRCPIASTVTGRWLSDDEARRPSYWSHHLRQPVRFAEAIATLGTDRVLLEVGPGQTLATLARQTLGPAAAIVSSLDHPGARQDDVRAMQAAVGRVWMNGAEVRWTSLHAEPRRRVALPTYPFERQRYWIEPDRSTLTSSPSSPDESGDRRDDSALSAATAVASRVEPSRGDEVGTQLKSVLSALSGIGAGDLDSSIPFLDLGFDSLLLTQVSAACQREFGVKVTMRQLLADLPTIGQLSSFLQSKEPTIAASAAEIPAVPVATVPGFKPPDRASSALSDVQQRHLDALIARYTTRTATSKQLTAKYRPVLADPRTVSGFHRAWKEMVYPIVVNRSSGARLWDVDGNEYIDLLNGFGPNFLGHSPSVVVEAMKAQLDCGIEVGPQTPLAGEVAELISEMTGMDRVSFVNTGSEAVQAAMRLARTVTGRDRVVVFAKDYHGNFDEVLVRGNVVDGQARSMPIAPGIPQRAVSDMVVLEYGSQEALDYISRHADTLAAVLIEPIQSRRPEFQPRAFIHEVRRLTERSGIVMIMDEVITGFRLGPGGAQAYYGVRADLATYGKVVGGGMPIGVVAGRADLMDTFDGGQWNYGDDSFPEKGVTFFAGTFVRHPLAMAAARASLKFLKAQPRELWDTVNRRTARLAGSVNAMLEEQAAPIELAHFGSQMFVRVRDDAKLANLVFYHLRERGVFLAEGFPTYLTIAHSESDIDTVVDAWRQSIAAMQEGGFFPEARLQPVVDRTVIQLTAAQKEIWLAMQMNPAGAVAFNEATTIRLGGELDVELLRDTCREVIARHDALGGTVSADGEHFQLSGPLELDVPLVDLSSATDGQAALDDLIEAEASTPFDLERGPLVRATLVKFSPGEHVLLLTAHHIVCDGWSFNVLVAELSEIYSSSRRGARAELMPPASFADFARGLNRSVGSPDDAIVEGYWLERLNNPPAALDLPTDRPRPLVREGRGNTVRRVIPEALATDVRALARRHGTTLFSALFAGYQVLLHRLSGQFDFCVGVPVASQSDPQFSALVGYAVNFLPFRATLSTNESFAAFMRRVRDEVADGLAHQPFTYGRLLPALSLPRSPGRLPLVEVEFNLERMDRYDEFEGLTSSFEAVTKRAANFDLFLNVVDTDDGFLLECDHATEILGSATVERWLASYEQLLRSAVADASRPIGSLDILSPAERRQSIVEFNRTAAEFPQAATLHGLFEEQCDRTPGAVAVVDLAGAFSYRELEARANRVAHRLRAEGTQPGDLIAVAVEPGVNMLATLLAVLKCGAAYVPIDLTHPQSRIDHILRNARPRLLVNDEWITSLATESGGPEPGNHARLNAAVSPSARAYVMHTSGTTGTPKGVEVEHRSVVNLLWSMRRSIGMTAEDRLLAITTLTFDIAALELFLPLVSGATVVFTRRETARDGHELAAELQAAAITVMQATPSTWRMLVEAGWPGDPNLRMLCGGEALPADLAKRLLPRGRTLWNVYGPTETTIWSSISQAVAGAPVTLGRPIANTQMYVLDADRNPLPIGVAGQLHIGGAGLARGYLNDAELTRSRFVMNPFEAGARLYATGDLVRHTAEGSIEFLRRIDDQVKVRGHRVELAEIELVLAAHPAIAAAAAAAEPVDGTHRIVAALVARTPPPSIDEVQAFLEQRLPACMWPSRIGFVDALPLTSSAKVDRRRLLDLVSTSSRRLAAVAARDETERTLARICAEALRIDTIGVFDDVFDLGADSLTVFQMSARARQAGLTVSPTDILLRRTVAALAASLTAESASSDRSRSEEQVMVRLGDGPDKSPMFLVHGVSGEVLSYEPLARAISARRPVFGFRAPLESLADRPSIERLASRYVAAMRSELPNGPFHIGGFCAGGLLAFEMARQLRAANAPVGVVAMLDCELDDTDRPTSSALEAVVGCLKNVPRWIADDARIYGWRHLMGRLRSRSRRIGRRLLGSDTALTAAALQDELGLWNLSNSELQVVVELHRSIEAYRPQAYEGRVLLVRPRANPLLDNGGRAPGLGWARYVASVDEVVVAGSHSTMLAAAFAGELAETIEVRLERADAQHERRARREPVEATVNASQARKRQELVNS